MTALTTPFGRRTRHAAETRALGASLAFVAHASLESRVIELAPELEMLATIEVHDESRRSAVEVRNEWPERMLASKLRAYATRSKT